MQKKDIYAVVDLETTKTSQDDGHIIQIAIAFVQNKTIINQFSTMINPGTNIPRHITQLTGITNGMVKHAPYFEEVAQTIHAMLQGTIFVAHNVNFDLPFLNIEFSRLGITPLDSDAIDTVPLSQLLWPTAPGYRLVDIAKYLGILHEHPHQADSDAATTAELFISILNRAQSLPMVTLQSLTDLPLVLPRQSKQVLVDALRLNREKPQPLAHNLQVIDGLAIRRFSAPAPLVDDQNVTYPAKPSQKKQLFGDTLTYRDEQAKLMNFVDHHYDQVDNDLSQKEPGTDALVIEAPTGMGKTLGYTLPYAYLAQKNRKQVVVSVPTITLQNQVVQVINQQLNAILPFEVRAVSLKGQTHYLNLQSFKRSLNVDEGSAALQFIKAQILVWLTETLTGDFDELNLINPQTEFMNKLSQPANNPTGSAFYGHEFSERQHIIAQESQFLVVNHAYLASYAHKLGPKNDAAYLVIDEPQHLPDAVVQQSRRQLNFNRWFDDVNEAQFLFDRSANVNIQTILTRIPGGRKLKNRFLESIHQLQAEIPQLETKLYRRFLLNQKEVLGSGVHDFPVDLHELAQFWVEQAGRVQKIHQGIADLQTCLNDFLDEFSQLKHVFSVDERQTIADFRRCLNLIANSEHSLTIFQQDLVEFPEASVFWLTQNLDQEGQHLKLSGGLLHTVDYFKTRVYPHFMPVTLIGATLFTSNKSNYLYDRLNIDRSTAEVHTFNDVFDYANQSEFILVNDAVNPTDSGYVDYLSRTIADILEHVHENTLILFNSLETIQQIYQQLQKMNVANKNQLTILAQGITGSRGRILKRMQNEQGIITLGANSFWEGVDLPAEQLRLVIITRLPFDQPNSIPQKAEEAFLRAQGRQPFYQSTLPKAVLRLRQGVGRLIRTPTDYGAVVMLDVRMLEKPYGKTLRNMLPKTMPQVERASQAVGPELAQFFKQHDEKQHHLD
ncbi:helicase C-terminal domain-containing protein [Weissella viridescens]|uniref:helicase C-terminal domain-containing protein n=2 Tax=Weissella TaxID=46255 RepID=UPI002574E655|nr:helicase C-terminal domain-containing protein [Weissella viridescens]WJI90521.1 helicase C-terminal domain-containing protein [Weissella viridescens]